jgi:hypothetical protein
VITKPPSISGIHISAPVRAVVPAILLDDAGLELVLELVLEFELEFELELDCAEAIPASDSVMTTPSSAPARIRRAINAVIRTLSLSPKRVCGQDPSSSPTPLTPATPGTGKASGGTLVGYPAPAK